MLTNGEFKVAAIFIVTAAVFSTTGVVFVQPTAQAKPDVSGQAGEDKAVANKAPTMASKDVAEKWIIALLSGKIDRLMSLSTVPFSWDRKMLIKTEDDLKALYNKVLANKGARDIKPSKIELADEAKTKKLLESSTFEKKPDMVAVTAWFDDCSGSA